MILGGHVVIFHCVIHWDRLPAIKRVLQEVVEEHNGDRSVEAQGLLAQLDLKLIVHLVTLYKIFGEVKSPLFFIALLTIQIVSKQLHNIKIGK